MDYSHPYFGAGQPYQFIGIPPLTPSHSNSAGSEDYNTTSPPEVYTDFPNEQYPTFDAYAAQFNPQQTFPGPPTPPNGLPPAVHSQQQQQQVPQPQAPHQQPHAQQPQQVPHPQLNGAHNGTHNGTQNGTQNSAAYKEQQISDGLAGSLAKADLADDPNRRAGSNSDDDDMTPAQSRRKAQNRAAQRAFRERKERKVKDLEAKLATLEEAQAHTATENERLKRDLQKMSTENEILRATNNAGSPGTASHAPITTGPLTYNPMDFYTDLLAGHDNKTPSHRVATSDAGERLLAAGAAWDLIIGHDLYKKGMVDVADISNRLKNQAKCDGQGPVFEERAIIMAIEQSVGSGSDELL